MINVIQYRVVFVCDKSIFPYTTNISFYILQEKVIYTPLTNVYHIGGHEVSTPKYFN